MPPSFACSFISLLWQCIILVAALPHQSGIRNFHPLSYERQTVHTDHLRVRRSTINAAHSHFRWKRDTSNYTNANVVPSLSSFYSNNDEKYIYLNLSTPLRSFRLRLCHDWEFITAPEGHAQYYLEDHLGDDNSVIIDHLYKGIILGEPRSRVYGSIVDGIFRGTIHTGVGPGKSFYVERAEHFFDHASVEPPHPDDHNATLHPNAVVNLLGFHSFIYGDDDVLLPQYLSKSEKSEDAKSKSQQQRRANQAFSHADPVSATVPKPPQDDADRPLKARRRPLSGGDEDDGDGLDGGDDTLEEAARKYKNSASGFTQGFKESQDSEESERSSSYCALDETKTQTFMEDKTSDARYEPPAKVRRKRAVRIEPDHKDLKTCEMYIQADPMLWKHYRDVNLQKGKSTQNANRIASRLCMENIHTAINGLNSIFELERNVFKLFDQYRDDYRIPFRARFEAKKTLVLDHPRSCPIGGGSNNPRHLLCEERLDVNSFLSKASEHDFDQFCLAYTLTWRDFSGGTLGLAWVGYPESKTGGVCERHAEQGRTGKKMSLNTGIVTLVNMNRQLPTRVFEQTVAHEVGHNFGSPHDDGSLCTPGGVQGNYIMYPHSSDGDKENNKIFSNCSNKNITRLLESIFDETKRARNKNFCFSGKKSAFCGNGIVEQGDGTPGEKPEDCDCGYKNECTETCCHPRDPQKAVDNDKQACKLKPRSNCSPSQGACCNSDTCNFIGANKEICEPESECKNESSCNGTSAECPKQSNKANGTPCQSFTKVCKEGDCKGSICDIEESGSKFEICSAPRRYVKEYEKESDKAMGQKLCYIHCQELGSPETCSTISDLYHENKHFNTGIKKQIDRFEKRIRAGSRGDDSMDLQLFKNNLEKREPILMLPGSPCDDFVGFCDVFQRCRRVDADGPLARLKKMIFDTELYRTIWELLKEYWWAAVLGAVGIVVVMALFIKVCAVHTPSSNPNKPPARNPMDTLRRMGTLPRRGAAHIESARSRRGGGGGGGAEGRANASGRSDPRAPGPGASGAAPKQGRTRPKSHAYSVPVNEGPARGHNRNRKNNRDRTRSGERGGGSGNEQRSDRYRVTAPPSSIEMTSYPNEPPPPYNPGWGPNNPNGGGSREQRR